MNQPELKISVFSHRRAGELVSELRKGQQIEVVIDDESAPIWMVLGTSEYYARRAAALEHQPLLIVMAVPETDIKEVEKVYARTVYMPIIIADRVVIGSNKEDLIDEVVGLVLRIPRWARLPIFSVSLEEAELVGFLAFRLASETAWHCQKRGLRYERVKEAIRA